MPNKNPRVPVEMIDACKYAIKEYHRKNNIDSNSKERISQTRMFLAWTRLKIFKELLEDSINCEIKNGK